MPRKAIQEFELANPIYRGASVTFYTVAGGAKTAVKATLYADSTSTTQLSNPQKLDSHGKFARPVYIDVPVIGAVDGIGIPTHDTGILSPAPTFRVNATTQALQYSFDNGVSWSDSGAYFFRDRGAWAGPGTVYKILDMVTESGRRYLSKTDHTSGATFAGDAANWVELTTLDATLAAIAALTGVADRGIYFTGVDTAALFTFPAFGRSVAAVSSALETRLLIDAQEDVITTAGDLVVGGAAGAATRKARGNEGEVLLVDPAQADKYVFTKLGAGDVRQSVLSAALDSNGYNAAITTGSGLQVGLDAAPSPMVLAFAAGYGTIGAQDLVATLSADAATIGQALPASNTSFIHATWASLTSVTWSSTLVPPQYGYAFDRTKGALLNFEAGDGTTTMLDDFGNTWTASGNAQIDTAQSKFGTASLLLDGTGDYVTTTNITTLGDGSWEIAAWVRWNALPAGATQFIVDARDAADATGFGVALGLNDTAGTKKLSLWLSSDGASWNIASAVLGANTAWAVNTQYKVRLVFDALAGSYKVFLSVNGAAETTDITVASTARVNALTQFRLGADNTGINAFNGWIDAFRFLPCATNTSAETPSAVAPTITDYPVHFFSIPEMKMYEVTAASAAAGTNPTLTARNQLFVAEADTSGVAVTAVRNYAIRGEYVSAFAAWPANGVQTAYTDNLGVPPHLCNVKLIPRNVTADQGWASGEVARVLSRHTAGAADERVFFGERKTSRNTSAWTVGANGVWIFTPTTGVSQIVTAGSWQQALSVRRAF